MACLCRGSGWLLKCLGNLFNYNFIIRASLLNTVNSLKQHVLGKAPIDLLLRKKTPVSFRYENRPLNNSWPSLMVKFEFTSSLKFVINE